MWRQASCGIFPHQNTILDLPCRTDRPSDPLLWYVKFLELICWVTVWTSRIDKMETTYHNQCMFFIFHFCALIFSVFRISDFFVFSKISGSPHVIFYPLIALVSNLNALFEWLSNRGVLMPKRTEQSAIDTGQGWESDPLLHKLQKKYFICYFFLLRVSFPTKGYHHNYLHGWLKTSHYFPPFLIFFTHRQTTEEMNKTWGD